MTEDTPTPADLIREVSDRLEALERGFDALPLNGSPRYVKLLLDIETHLANAVSAMGAAVVEAHKE